jgi:hypothetical protein
LPARLSFTLRAAERNAGARFGPGTGGRFSVSSSSGSPVVIPKSPSHFLIACKTFYAVDSDALHMEIVVPVIHAQGTWAQMDMPFFPVEGA